MKNTIMFLLLTSSSFAFELSFDTINAGVYQPYVAGESKTLYVNAGSDTIHFDSVRVDLIKSETGQYQMGPISCSFTDVMEKVFYFCNYDTDLGLGDNLNDFKFDLGPNETVIVKLEGFDYQLFGIIPEAGPAPLNPPKPMQAKMVFFTNKGIDSIIINGTQTNQPRSNAVISSPKYIRRTTNGQAEYKYYTINGKLVNSSSIKKTGMANGIGITSEKYPDGRVVYKKSLLTR
jgi:hypothetical protein